MTWLDNALEAHSEPGRLRTRARTGRWTWALLASWLLYSAAMLAWYLINDPEIFNAICRTRP